ncbi:MAG: phosphatidylserine decarboxylase [Candidatus Lokiarchaeota archaeon]|nr:phosphatidylserine decarboxylase [Candidatus Harpocratesius repetitus]
MRFAKEGFFWVVPALALDIGWHIISLPTKYNPWLYFWVITFPTTVGIILLASFFRDPERELPENFNPKTDVVCPADGTVVSIEQVNDLLSIYIEMHYYNVHVVRSPCNLIVDEVIRQKGKHHLVYFVKTSTKTTTKAILKNARTIVKLKNESGEKIDYYMICGAFFRRAKPYVKAGDKLSAGDRVGMIVFGSTLKMVIPFHNQSCCVKVGEKVRAGKTILFQKEVDVKNG